MKNAAPGLFLLAVLSGCEVAYHDREDVFLTTPLCYDAAPGRPLSAYESSRLEHALDHRLFVGFDDDVSFRNPIGPGRCYGDRYDGWPYVESGGRRRQERA